uniref:Transmembrane protein n=1 Tax=Ascaris lumbricoides TaxID=6252 RepID=A0A0M3IQG5_ASCLU
MINVETPLQMFKGFPSEFDLLGSVEEVHSKRWRKFHKEGAASNVLPASTRLFPTSCMPMRNVTESELDYCEQWIKEKPVWEKVVAACMIVGLISEVMGLIMAKVVAACMSGTNEVMGLIMAILILMTCCDKRAANIMLPAFAPLATILIVVAVTLYGIKNEKAIGAEGFNKDVNKNMKNIEKVMKSSSLGYSFYMAVLASLIGIVASVFGGTVVSFYKQN